MFQGILLSSFHQAHVNQLAHDQTIPTAADQFRGKMRKQSPRQNPAHAYTLFSSVISKHMLCDFFLNLCYQNLHFKISSNLRFYIAARLLWAKKHGFRRRRFSKQLSNQA